MGGTGSELCAMAGCVINSVEPPRSVTRELIVNQHVSRGEAGK
jgi:hypothetical protein